MTPNLKKLAAVFTVLITIAALLLPAFVFADEALTTKSPPPQMPPGAGGGGD